MTIEEVLSFEEMQIFDRKSINIEPKALAIPLVAFGKCRRWNYSSRYIR